MFLQVIKRYALAACLWQIYIIFTLFWTLTFSLTYDIRYIHKLRVTSVRTRNLTYSVLVYTSLYCSLTGSCMAHRVGEEGVEIAHGASILFRRSCSTNHIGSPRNIHLRLQTTSSNNPHSALQQSFSDTPRNCHCIHLQITCHEPEQTATLWAGTSQFYHFKSDIYIYIFIYIYMNI